MEFKEMKENPLFEYINTMAEESIRTDITDKETLKKERLRLFQVLDLIPAFIYLIGKDHSIRFANRKFLEAFGEPGNRPCYEILRGKKEPCKECKTFSVFETKTPLILEFTNKFGRTYVNYDSFFPSDEEEMVMEVGIEITALKETEEHLRYRLSAEGLIITISNRFINIPSEDIDKEIHNALKAIGEFTGVERCFIALFSGEEMFIEKIYAWCPEYRKKAIEVYKGSSARQFQWAIKKFKNAEYIHCSIEDLPEEAAIEKEFLKKIEVQSFLYIPMIMRNSLTGCLGFNSEIRKKQWSKEDINLLKLAGEIFVNVLDRKKRDEEHRAMEARIRHMEKLESLGIMSGGIAHEFNNILSGIMGYSEMALWKLQGNESVKDMIKSIKKASERAAGITRQILTYTGFMETNREKIHLSDLIKSMTEFLSILSSEKYILQYYLSEELPLFEGDPDQVKQIIINLLINASEALDEQGVIKIATGVMNCTRTYLSDTLFKEDLPEGLYVYLEVTDTGCGIKEEDHIKIFDPFFTTKFPGRGLGLPVVLGIVRIHRGTIKVCSKQNKGTTILILFPCNVSQSL
ncbi:MAG: ATP-binding protein [Candidatus Eremiobacterota bacterium]